MRSIRSAWGLCLLVLSAWALSQSAKPLEIKVGKSPNFMRVAPSGKHALVTNFGSDEVSLIDLAGMRQTRKAPAGYGPLGLAFGVDGNLVYISNMESGLVKVFSYPALELIETLKVGHLPTDLVATPDGYSLLVANYGKGKWGRLDVLDLQRKRVTQTIKVGVKPLAVVTSESGDKAYVANSAENTISVVSLEVYKVLETITVGDGPNGLAMSRNGRKLLVTHSRSNDLWIYDLRRKTVLQKIPLPAGPFRLSWSPDESLIAVACCQAGQVALVDGDTTAEAPVRTLTVKKKPVDVVFTPDGGRILVSCEDDDRVLVLPVPAKAAGSAPEKTDGR